MPDRRAPLAASLALMLLPACGDPGDTGDTDTGGASDSGLSSDGATEPGPGSVGTTTDDSTSTAATSSATTDADSTADEPTTGATSDPSTTTGGGDELPPTDSAEQLEAWLAGGVYKSWPAESQIHASTGPHGGNVRTFVNDALDASLAGAAAMHPQGAATVKELYGGGTDTIIGYAVMVKLAPDSANGDNWYWYERLDATVYADGTGVGLCTGCHEGGSDYVLTPYPLQ